VPENSDANQTLKQTAPKSPWRWVLLFAVLQLAWIAWLALVAFGVLG